MLNVVLRHLPSENERKFIRFGVFLIFFPYSFLVLLSSFVSCLSSVFIPSLAFNLSWKGWDPFSMLPVFRKLNFMHGLRRSTYLLFCCFWGQREIFVMSTSHRQWSEVMGITDDMKKIELDQAGIKWIAINSFELYILEDNSKGDHALRLITSPR